MANRPFVSFAEVKEKVSIPQVLQVLGLLDRFQCKGGSKFSGVCPLADHAHGPSPNPDQFKIDCKNGVWVWHCFGDCARGGDVIELVKGIKGYSDSHARLFFAEHFASVLTLKKPNKKGATMMAAKKDTASAAAADGNKIGVSPDGAKAPAVSKSQPSVPSTESMLKPLPWPIRHLDPNVPYLAQRGVKPETIQRYGLGLASSKSRLFSGYIVMPLFHPRQPDQLLGYLGRWPGEDWEAKGQSRYKLPPNFPKSEVLFGLREAPDGTDGKPLIVVEGPFDCFSLCQAGYPATVALLGSSLSDAQAEILSELGRPICLMFDGDEAGQHGMRTAAAKLITRCWVRVVRLQEEQQPDRLSPDQLKEHLSFLP